ncbi:MAG: hypothetical protein FJY07_05905 [Bacteroidetes bacterium]|nr:hypothetical protein [Bacteroidota bacterium]
MVGQTVYTDFNILEEIFLFKDDFESYGLLYKIIMDFSDVMINIEDEEFNKIKENNIFIKSLIKRPDKKIYPLKRFFENILEEDLSNFPRDIFILNESQDFCNSSMQKFGVLVLNSSDLNEVKALAKRHKKIYSKDEVVETYLPLTTLKGWHSFINDLKLHPLNSIVIIDNHIFNNRKAGIRNLVNLIESILPENLNVPFHILIIIDNREVKFNQNALSKFKDEIKNQLSVKVDYEIKIGILSHSLDDEFHNRVLISNYFIITSDYGFDCFDNERSKKSFTTSTSSAYYTLFVNQGDPEIKLITQKLKAVKSLRIGNLKSNNQNETFLLVGESDNRLLDSV